MTETKFISNKKEGLSMGAVTFLLIILIITISLYLYNSIIEKNIAEIDTKISQREADIKQLEKNDKLQAYALITANKKFIDELAKRNQVTKYINHLAQIEEEYKVKLFGFKLSNGAVSSSIISESNDDGIAYVKTKDFIKKYRINEKSLFDLEFINSVEGMDNMKFNVSMKIK